MGVMRGMWLAVLAGVCVVAGAQQPTATLKAKPKPAGPAGQTDANLRKADVAFRAGYAAVQAGNLAEAEARFAEAVRFAPQMALAHQAYGTVLAQRQKPELAVPELERALVLEKKQGQVDAGLLTNLMLAREVLGLRLAGTDAEGARLQLELALAAAREVAVQARLKDEQRA